MTEKEPHRQAGNALQEIDLCVMARYARHDQQILLWSCQISEGPLVREQLLCVLSLGATLQKHTLSGVAEVSDCPAQLAQAH